MGKIIGFIVGFFIRGLPMAIIGMVLGHFWVDEKRHKKSQYVNSSIFGRGISPASLFIQTTFAVLGRLSKSKGQVTDTDIALALNLMRKLHLDSEDCRLAKQSFQRGKEESFLLRTAIRELRDAYTQRDDLLQIFLETLFQAAASDGQLHPEERRILLVVADELGLSRAEFEQLLSMFFAGQHFEQHYSQFYRSSQRQSSQESRYQSARSSEQSALQDAFAILGVAEDADQNTVKQAYRRLMHQYHPDRLVAKGLPEEMMKMATEKTQQIQSAYALVCQTKGWR